ncbi:MAG: LuxR C-terminal-related transcriptional regulator [Anaerovoracaceae bacterium]
MRLLVVDSHPLIRKGIVQVLGSDPTNNNYKIFEASTVAEAMSILKDEPVDLTFVGLHLKDGSGFDLISRIRDTKGKRIKCILLASSISVFEFRRAEQLYVDGYVLKETDEDDLRYAYNLILKGKKYYPPKLVDKALEIKNEEGMRLLTDREMDVLIELSKGLTNSQIGSNLYISEGTTKKHISNILTKLNMSNRMEVLVYANKLSGE